MTEILRELDRTMGFLPTVPEMTADALDLELRPGERAKEKREIRDRLIAYRAKHGLGCFNELATGEVSANELRNMLLGDPPQPLSKWLAAKAALDKGDRNHGKL